MVKEGVRLSCSHRRLNNFLLLIVPSEETSLFIFMPIGCVPLVGRDQGRAPNEESALGINDHTIDVQSGPLPSYYGLGSTD